MCTKRVRSRAMARGSVFRRSGGWAFRIDTGFHPGTGQRRQMLKQGFATRKAAQAAVAEAMNSTATGSVVAKSTVRVEAFLTDWLETVRSRLRPTTFYSYEMAVHRITSALGRYQLQALTPLQIEKFYGQLLAGGGRGGRRRSAKTVRNTHVVLRKALSDAERLGLVARNAAAAAHPPVPSRKDLITWSSEELRLFLAGVQEDPLFVAYALLATTGMRRGEVLGLRWSDVDFDGAQVAVSHTLTTAGERLVMGPPKTQRSRRHVYLDAKTLAILRDHRKRQREDRLAAGSSWCSDVDLVAQDPIGRPIAPDWLSRAFRRHVRSAGVPQIRLHDLRHTYATLALKAGVHPKVVSERLGHATVGVTLDLYSHVVPSIARDAADVVARTIFDGVR
jgi:integrase